MDNMQGVIFEKVQNRNDQTFAISFSLSDIKAKIPRVNLKKIKLTKLQNIDLSLKTKNVTRVFLDDSLLKLDLPIKRTTQEKNYESGVYNPLRKKAEQVEKLPEIKEIEDEEPLIIQENKIDKELVTESPFQVLDLEEEEKKDITFNLEAQIVQDEENVIFSPATVLLPPFKEDIVSSSGEQSAFVWPPLGQKEEKIIKQKKKAKEKKTKKKKPYFIKTEGQTPEKKEEVKPNQILEETVAFPWVAQREDYQSFENIIQGGLESTLLDIPEPALPFVKELPPVLEASSTPVVFKAITPGVTVNEGEISQSIKIDAFFTGSNKLNYGIELQERVKKMFEKIGSAKITPIRIIIFGGFVATLGYLIYGYFFGDLKLNYLSEEKNDKLVVRDLFKQKHIYNKKDLAKSAIGEKARKTENEIVFKPISEQERLSLIQMAREALENRLDPFGQEAVLPRSVIEKKIKDNEGEKASPDIQLLRKQVELVGVISTKANDLALVNVYTADYTVSPDDEEGVRETKLKSALSMAVPNRIEVSVLDPVEGWYVKQIQKSKSRSEDPYIDLVKENKKFKLKVGQKVLLPEEKPQDEVTESTQ